MARNTLKYDLNVLALGGSGSHSHKSALSDLTVKSYKASVSDFCNFAKSIGIKTMQQLEKYGKKDVLQKYAAHLSAEGKTAGTIHTRLAPICKACDLNMKDIEKPKRYSAEIKKGRYVVDRSEREANLGRYKDSVDLQKALGIRRNELKNLTGSDLIRSNDGRLYVIVRSGKGGKRQLQRILPQYEATVCSFFEGKGAEERIVPQCGISKNINYHGYRADLAKEAYKYYANLPEAQRERLRKFLVMKYERSAKPSEWALKTFKKQVYSDKPYLLRGKNLQLALEKGLPIEYDRLALMAVSVEHLSHWRLDVTVCNYMLA